MSTSLKDKVTSYTADWLQRGGEDMNALADQWENAATDQHNEVMGIVGETWKGLGGTAYGVVSHEDYLHAQAAAVQARTAGAVHLGHFALLTDAAQLVRSTVATIEADNVTVNPDLSLTDKTTTYTNTEKYAREYDVAQHALRLNAAVQALVTGDQQAGADVRAATDFSPHHTGTNGHIGAVDFKTDGPGVAGDGSGDPPGEPPMPEVGGDYVGSSGTGTPLEADLPGPSLPKYYPGNPEPIPPPQPSCSIGSYAKKTGHVALDAAAETAELFALPFSGPTAILDGMVAAGTADKLVEDSADMIDCAEQGFGS
jgi:hypothetical protein